MTVISIIVCMLQAVPRNTTKGMKAPEIHGRLNTIQATTHHATSIELNHSHFLSILCQEEVLLGQLFPKNRDLVEQTPVLCLRPWKLQSQLLQVKGQPLLIVIILLLIFNKPLPLVALEPYIGWTLVFRKKLLTSARVLQDWENLLLLNLH